MMCSVQGCDERATTKTFCNKHYQRWYKYGDPSKQVKVRRNGCPAKYANGYIYLYQHQDQQAESIHRLLAAKALGRELTGEEEVHHLDGVKTNNANNNLVVCPNRQYHMTLHQRTNAFVATGNPNLVKCSTCGKWKYPHEFYQRSNGGRTSSCRGCDKRKEMRRISWRKKQNEVKPNA